MINQTLVFIQKEDKLLLGLKKRGFGTGRYNGFGGKVTEGEEIEGAARRELKEEIGIEVDKLEPVGELIFYPVKFPEGVKVYFFRATDFRGEPQESEEMKPDWFDINSLPYEKMWDDDKYWMPMFLEGKKFTGTFRFDENDKTVEHELHQAADDGIDDEFNTKIRKI